MKRVLLAIAVMALALMAQMNTPVPTGFTGAPVIVAKSDQFAQTANIGGITVYTVPTTLAGTYRATCYVVQTVVATTATLPTCIVSYTDNDSNAGVSLFLTLTSTADALGAAGPTATNGYFAFNAKASTAVSFFTTAYASTGTPMQYAVHFKLEFLGP